MEHHDKNSMLHMTKKTANAFYAFTTTSYVSLNSLCQCYVITDYICRKKYSIKFNVKKTFLDPVQTTTQSISP